MNPVTFNEPFKAFCNTPKIHDTVKWALREAMNAPLIVWENKTKKEMPREVFDMAPKDKGGFPKLPFERFRAYTEMHGQDGSVVKTKTAVIKDGDYIHMYTKVVSLTGAMEEFIKFLVHGDLIIYSLVDALGRHAVTFLDEKTGDHVKGLEPLEHHESIKGLSIGVTVFIAIDFSNPHLHCVRVSPPASNSRSVEWIKAREHYVLLHKNHAANSPRVARGEVIRDDAQVIRTAHSRRAHFRLLSSPKFKNKRGHRVWVRSMWVGPKEWKDRSGQIYRIIEKGAASMAA